MSNKLTPFEKQLKGSLDKLSFPYDSGEWTKLEGKLGTSASASSVSWMAAVVAAIATMSLFSVSTGPTPETANPLAEVTAVEMEASPIKEGLEEESVPTTVEPMASTEDVHAQEQMHSQAIVINIDPQTHSPVMDNDNRENEENNAQANAAIKTDSAEAKTEVVEILLEKNHLCVGEEVRIDITQNSLSVPLKLNLGGELSPIEDFEVLSFNAPGSYPISITNKRGEEIWSDYVIVSSAELEFGLETGAEIRPETEVIIRDQQPNTRYSVAFDGETADKNSKLLRSIGHHEVSVTAINQEGCSVTKSETVFIDSEYNLLAPTAFSPNNDGVNDVWLPLALSYYQESTLIITSPIHGVVHQSTDGKGWNGRLPNGSIAAAGETFSWKCTVTIDGQEEVYMGRITVFNR